MGVQVYDDIPVFEPNSVVVQDESEIRMDGKTYEGFYVSYNSHDRDSYGDVTTALVLGQMEKFFILNGDHRAGYTAAAAEGGFEKCLEYFKKNPGLVNKYSEQ